MSSSWLIEFPGKARRSRFRTSGERKKERSAVGITCKLGGDLPSKLVPPTLSCYPPVVLHSRPILGRSLRAELFVAFIASPTAARFLSLMHLHAYYARIVLTEGDVFLSRQRDTRRDDNILVGVRGAIILLGLIGNSLVFRMRSLLSSDLSIFITFCSLTSALAGFLIEKYQWISWI